MRHRRQSSGASTPPISPSVSLSSPSPHSQCGSSIRLAPRARNPQPTPDGQVALRKK